jgi:hypothetical protein
MTVISLWSKAEVHKIPARVQCTVQVCELMCRTCTPPPYLSRQNICLSHSESVRLPLQLPMRPSPHQLHAGPFHPVHACTEQQHPSSHTARCARLVHLWSKETDINWEVNIDMLLDINVTHTVPSMVGKCNVPIIFLYREDRRNSMETIRMPDVLQRWCSKNVPQVLQKLSYRTCRFCGNHDRR